MRKSSEPNEACAPLWEGLAGKDEAGPYLQGGRCSACGTVTLLERHICPHCWSAAALQPARIGRSGRLYTRTVVHQAPEGFDVPYVAGLVDLDEGPRVFAHLEAGAASPAIGDRVALVLAPLRHADGSALVGPRYRKVS